MEDDINPGRVFTPTYDEFQNFHTYIQEIESLGAHDTGIVKIVSPDEWKPKMKIKTGQEPIPKDRVIIKPIRQEINGKGGIFTHRNSDQPNMTLEEYKQKIPDDGPLLDRKAIQAVEKLFWENKTSSTKTKELFLYGPAQNGTLFTKDENVWNLDNLESPLDILKEMKGIQKSYLYYGSKRSFFPVHTEDGNIYSVNINHYGSPKIWYSVPPEDGERLEQLIAKFYPAASKCPGFIRHKTFLVSPDMCKMNKIRCYRTVQYPGDIVVTFPFGYHWGFNVGYNIAEASNFATESYINFGKKASPCICGNSVPIQINVDCFVKLFQPDQYDAWRKDGKDSCELDFNWRPPAPDGNTEGWRDKVTKLLKEYGAKRPGEEPIGLHEYLKLSTPADPDAPPFRHQDVKFSTLDDRLYAVAAMNQTDGKAIDTCKKKLLEVDETSGRHSSKLHGEMAPYCSMCHVIVHTKTLSDISDSPFLQKNELTKVDQSRFPRSKVLIPECSFTMSKKDVNTKDVADNKDPHSEIQSDLLDCCECKVRVHAKCYGVDSEVIKELKNAGVEWTCDRCKSDKRCRKTVSKCCWLCGKWTGAMKIMPGSRSNKWVHLTCAMADPRIYFEDVATRTISAHMGGEKEWEVRQKQRC